MGLFLYALVAIFGLACAQVEEKKIIFGHGDGSFNIAGYSSYKKLQKKMETYLYNEMVNSFSFIFNVSGKNTSDFLSYVNPERFLTLQLLNSFYKNDVVYGNLLLKVGDSFLPSKPYQLKMWFESNIHFPRDTIYDIVKFIAMDNCSRLLPIPKPISDQVVFMNDKYKIFEEACARGDVDVIKWFIKSGIDLGTVSWDTLEDALHKGNMQVVKILLENNYLNKANLTKNKICETIHKHHLVNIAAQFGLVNCIPLLLDAGANINEEDSFGMTPLHSAVISNEIPVIPSLVSYGANITCVNSNSGDSLLHTAAEFNNTNLTALLLTIGVPPNIVNNAGVTPLYIAVQKKHVQMMYILVFRGADVNFTTSSGETLMHLACSINSSDIVRALITLGAAVDKKNIIEETPLFLAAKRRNFPIMNMLLAKGAELYTKDRKGLTLLHKAAKLGDIVAVSSLIKIGISVNIKGLHGITPLYTATDEGITQLVEFLLENGADPNILNDNEWSPLHKAAQWGFEDIVVLLLEKGANANITTSSGWSPLALAKEFDHRKIASIIISKLDTEYLDIDVRRPKKEPLDFI